MKVKNKRILSLLTAAAIIATTIHSPFANNSSNTVESVTAKYAEDEVYVGTVVDSSKISVTLTYADGSTEVIPEGDIIECKLDPMVPKVTEEGSNVWTVAVTTADGDTHSATLDIWGYKVKALKAEYTGDPIEVGHIFNSDSVTTKVVYTNHRDGSAHEDRPGEFDIVNEAGQKDPTITKAGYNNFVAKYTENGEELTATFKVPGYAFDYVDAKYNGESIYIGTDYNKEDVEVYNVFTQGTELEPIRQLADFSVNSLTVNEVGDNTFTATTNRGSGDFVVHGHDTKPYIVAEYKGEAIAVGGRFYPKDLNVTLYEIKNGVATPFAVGSDYYTVSNNWVIKEVGENVFTITLNNLNHASNQGLTTTVTVMGVAPELVVKYNGNGVLVGDTFDPTDFTAQLVTVFGENNSDIDDVNVNELIFENAVTTAGENVINVKYGDYTTTVNVWGYAPDHIEAEYTGGRILVGEKFDSANVGVKLFYTPFKNNTVKEEVVEDFKVLNNEGKADTTVVSEGANVYTVYANGLTDDITVNGYTNPNEKAELVIVYEGPNIEVGQSFNLGDCKMTWIKADGSYGGTMSAGNSEMKDRLITKAGENEFTFTARNGISGTFTVWGYEEKELTATYSGPAVEAGKELDTNNVSVNLLYTERTDGGETSKVITDYVLLNDKGEETKVVANVGENKFTVKYNNLTTEMLVLGFDGTEIVDIKAKYEGPDVLVGTEATLAGNLKLTITRASGISEEFTVDTKDKVLVTAAGKNEFTFTYEGIDAKYEIWGYAPARIEAEYAGNDILVGSKFNSKDVNVTLYYTPYSDGTVKEEKVSRFDIKNANNITDPTVLEAGYNNFLVEANGFVDTIKVWGYEPSHIETEYTGKDILVGNKINARDIVAKLYYTPYSDGTIKEESISSSKLGFDATVQAVGNNKVEVSYAGMGDVVFVWGYAPSYIDANYAGGDVLVGQAFNTKDLTTTLYYTPNSDGTIKQETIAATKLTFDGVVKATGENEVEIAYGELKDTIKVWGYTPDYIKAQYNGKDMLVAETVTTKNITATLYYTKSSDGTVKEEAIAANKLVVDAKINKVGENEVVVKYNDLTDTVKIWGYAPERLVAEYVGKDVLVGNKFDSKSVNVKLYYTPNSDGTVKEEVVKTFNLTNAEGVADPTVTAVDYNTFTVEYNGLTDEIKVWGYQPDRIEANYTGKDILVGEKFDSKNVTVKLIYTPNSDGTVKEEAVKTFELTNAEGVADPTVTAVEYNVFTVTHENFTDEIKVWGYRPVAIKAIYTGKDIFVGNTFNSKDVKVELIYTPYSDETTRIDTIAIKDCKIFDALEKENTTVLKAGNNAFTVQYNDLKTTLDVWGYGVDKVEAKYSGKDIVVGNKYNKADVKVTVTFTPHSDEKVDVLEMKTFELNSLDVTKAGENKFEASCEYGKAEFVVNGLRTNNVIKVVAVDGNGSAVNGVELVYAIGEFKGTITTGGTDNATLGVNTPVVLDNLTVGIPANYKLTNKEIVAEESPAFTTYVVKVTLAAYDPNEVKTGDEANTLLYVALGGASLLGIAFLALSKKKKEDDAE